MEKNCCAKCSVEDYVESEFNPTKFCGNNDCLCHIPSVAEQIEVSPAKKLIDHHMNMIRDNLSLSIQKPFIN